MEPGRKLVSGGCLLVPESLQMGPTKKMFMEIISTVSVGRGFTIKI
jgi:hypothetical protein